MKKKKRGPHIKINLTNRWLYTLITIGILAILGVGVYAYGTSSPSTFGHSSGEVDVTIGTTTKTLQEAIDAGDLSGGGGLWTQSGTTISYTDGLVNSAQGIYSSTSFDGTGNAAYFPYGLYVPQSPTSWIYSDTIYLGSTSGDTINFRANTITGTGTVTAGNFECTNCVDGGELNTNLIYDRTVTSASRASWINAVCDSGDEVVGGGCDCRNAGTYDQIDTTIPSSSVNGWFCQCRSTSGTVTAHVLCLNNN